MDIRKKLPLSMILLVVIPLIALGFILYAYISEQLIEYNKKNMDTIMEVGSRQVMMIREMDLMGVKQIAEKEVVKKFMTNYYEIDVNRRQNMENYDQKLLNHVKTFIKKQNRPPNIINNIFIDIDGNVILKDKDINGDFKKIIDKYPEILKKEGIIKNCDLESKIGKNNYLVTYPIKNNDKKDLGAFITIQSYDILLNIFRDLHLGYTGATFIMESDGKFPDFKKYSEEEKEIINSRELKNVISDINANKDEIKKGIFIVNKKEKLVKYNYMPKFSQIFIAYQDLNEIRIPAKAALNTILLVMLLLVFLVCIVTMILSKSITNPITELMNAMSKAENGDLNLNIKHKNNNEFGRLFDSFNKMISILKNNYEELNNVYTQLSDMQGELEIKYDELEKNESRIKKIKEKYALAVDGSDDAIWVYDCKTSDFYFSDKWKEIIGVNIVKANNFIEILQKIVHEDYLEKTIIQYNNNLEHDFGHIKLEFKAKHNDDKWISLRGSIKINNEDNTYKISGSVSDISIRKKTEEKIIYLAYYDTLTNVPNKFRFYEDIESILDNCKDQNEEGALLFIDIDNFKRINDDLGHNVGDLVLKKICKKIQQKLKPNEKLYRYGGDEFLLLIPTITSEKDLKVFCDNFSKEMSNYFDVNGRSIYLSISMGVTIFPKDGDKSNIILKNADTALNVAKEVGRNRCYFYEEKMYNKLKRKNYVEKILRYALDNDGFEVYYQPQINCKDMNIYGFEALLRFKNNELRNIVPKEFIPVAEDTGLIVPMGNWILKEACRQNKIWKDKGYKYNKISVNISVKQLVSRDFIKTVKDILEETKLEPENLDLEITETVFLYNAEDKIKILEELNAMGISISLDDFGTGYSSLNYLKDLPVSCVKIDKSFVDDIYNNANSSIIDIVTVVAQKLNLNTIAEGVEDFEQFEILKSKQCDVVQGYLFSKPINADEAESLLTREFKYRK